MKFSHKDLTTALEVGQRWYAVHCRQQREAIALTQLQFQGYRVFMPVRWKTIRHARRLKTVRAPLFPRYLFVAFDPGRDRWRRINGTLGVCSLVMAGDRPQPVPLDIVENFVALTDNKGIMRFDSELTEGQRVRLLKGPFCELIGELEQVNDAGRARILLKVMGGEFPVWSEIDSLAPVA